MSLITTINHAEPSPYFTVTHFAHIELHYPTSGNPNYLVVSSADHSEFNDFRRAMEFIDLLLDWTLIIASK